MLSLCKLPNRILTPMSKIVCIATLIAILTSSCKKDGCTANCADIHISGQVVDTSTNTGVANMPILVQWNSYSTSILMPDKGPQKITGTRTNKDGYFDLIATVDKGKFGSYYISIETQLSEKYLNNYIPQYISQYTATARNLKLTIYPKAKLSIQLVNTQNDTFSFFDLLYSYSPTRIGIASSTWPLSNKTYTVETAANIYTRIDWTKGGNGFGQRKDYSDSIRCVPDKENIFVLNY